MDDIPVDERMMDDKLNTKEDDSNVENCAELEKHKSHLLAELDAVLGLPAPSSGEVRAEEESKATQKHREVEKQFSSDSANQFENEFSDQAKCLGNGLSMPVSEEPQKAAGNLSSLKEVETNHLENKFSESDKRPSEGSDTQTSHEEVIIEKQDHSYSPFMKYKFDFPIMALDYVEEFSTPKENFTKGCKWSPDGSCLLVGSDDGKMRLLNLPAPVSQGEFQRESWFMGESQLYSKAAVTIQERELIYDYAWYPLMQSNDPHTCCFAVTCRDHPVHLWDAWTGKLICSYHSYDHLDQLVAAYSIGFNEDGSQLLCGFNKCIRVFHTSRPGRDFSKIDAKGQPGIISCMAFNPQLPSVFVAGSYLGTLGLYNLQGNNLFCRMEGCQAGVTHVQFTADGTKLFSGTRKDNEILCWDIRNLGTILSGYKREVSTNQRIYFDLEPQLSRFLVSGNTKGQALIWDLENNNEANVENGDIPLLVPSSSFTAHKDCTNGISIHPYCPIIATSSGQRHFPEPVSEHDSDSGSESEVPKPLFTRQKIVQESTVKLWWLGGL